MLNKSDAVGKGKYRDGKTEFYLFRCAGTNCDKTVRVTSGHLKKRRGPFCRQCAHKGAPFRSTYNALLDSVKRNNAKRGLDRKVSLTFEEFLAFTEIGCCHYCDSPIDWRPHLGDGRYRANLDRKDNSKGYSRDNVVVCCTECNWMKRDFYTYDEFRLIRQLIRILRNDQKAYPKIESALVGWHDCVIELSRVAP